MEISSKLPDTGTTIFTVMSKLATDHKVLRFCFAKNDDTLETAAEILCKI